MHELGLEVEQQLFFHGAELFDVRTVDAVGVETSKDSRLCQSKLGAVLLEHEVGFRHGAQTDTGNGPAQSRYQFREADGAIDVLVDKSQVEIAGLKRDRLHFLVDSDQRNRRHDTFQSRDFVIAGDKQTGQHLGGEAAVLEDEDFHGTPAFLRDFHSADGCRLSRPIGDKRALFCLDDTPVLPWQKVHSDLVSSTASPRFFSVTSERHMTQYLRLSIELG